MNLVVFGVLEIEKTSQGAMTLRVTPENAGLNKQGDY